MPSQPDHIHNTASLIEQVRNRLIVSCQALPHEPLFGAETMAKMALAAALGGAKAIRANTPLDITAIRQTVDLPIIGLWKVDFTGFPVYITPTIEQAQAVAEAGADIIAIDATNRPRPQPGSLADFIQLIQQVTGKLVLADVATHEEGVVAEAAGADIVSTTMSGYTDDSPKLDGPDLELVRSLAKVLRVPLFAEGRYRTPEQVKQALALGATAVIVGGAITRPQEITKWFVAEVEKGEFLAEAREDAAGNLEFSPAYFVPLRKTLLFSSSAYHSSLYVIKGNSMITNQSKLSATKRAQELLARQPLFLDTETTGTTATSEIVEICILNHEGKVLIDSLVKPRRKIPSDATRIHGIDNGMVMNAPSWSELWPQIEVSLSGRTVGIYNAEFDLRLIKQTHLQSGLAWNSLNAAAACLMKLYAEFHSDWDRYRGGYRWQSLADAGRQCGVNLPNAHRAYADTLLAREILLHMAEKS